MGVADEKWCIINLIIKFLMRWENNPIRMGCLHIHRATSLLIQFQFSTIQLWTTPRLLKTSSAKLNHANSIWWASVCRNWVILQPWWPHGPGAEARLQSWQHLRRLTAWLRSVGLVVLMMPTQNGCWNLNPNSMPILDWTHGQRRKRS